MSRGNMYGREMVKGLFTLTLILGLLAGIRFTARAEVTTETIPNEDGSVTTRTVVDGEVMSTIVETVVNPDGSVITTATTTPTAEAVTTGGNKGTKMPDADKDSDDDAIRTYTYQERVYLRDGVEVTEYTEQEDGIEDDVAFTRERTGTLTYDAEAEEYTDLYEETVHQTSSDGQYKYAETIEWTEDGGRYTRETTLSDKDGTVTITEEGTQSIDADGMITEEYASTQDDGAKTIETTGSRVYDETGGRENSEVTVTSKTERDKGKKTTSTVESVWTQTEDDDKNTVTELISIETQDNRTITVYLERNGGTDDAELEVTLDMDGGSIAPGETPPEEWTIGNLPIPERSGYRFTGWRLDEDDGEALDDDEELTDGMELIAGWERTANRNESSSGRSSGKTSDLSHRVSGNALRMSRGWR